MGKMELHFVCKASLPSLLVQSASELVLLKHFVKGGIQTLNVVVRGRQGIADTNAVQRALENLAKIAVVSPTYH